MRKMKNHTWLFLLPRELVQLIAAHLITLESLGQLTWVCRDLNCLINREFIQQWIVMQTGHASLTFEKLSLPEYQIALNDPWSGRHCDSFRLIKENHPDPENPEFTNLQRVRLHPSPGSQIKRTLEWIRSLNGPGHLFLKTPDLGPYRAKISLLHVWFTFMDRSGVSLNPSHWQLTIHHIKAFSDDTTHVDFCLETLWPSSRSLIFTLCLELEPQGSSVVGRDSFFRSVCHGDTGLRHYLTNGWLSLRTNFCWNGIRCVQLPHQHLQFDDGLKVVVDVHTQILRTCRESISNIFVDTFWGLVRCDWLDFQARGVFDLTSAHLQMVPQVFLQDDHQDVLRIYHFLLTPFTQPDESVWNHATLSLLRLRIDLNPRFLREHRLIWDIHDAMGEIRAQGHENVTLVEAPADLPFSLYPIVYWANPTCLIMELIQSECCQLETFYFHFDGTHPILFRRMVNKKP